MPILNIKESQMSEILRMQEQIEEYLLTLPINTLITMGSLKKC